MYFINFPFHSISQNCQDSNIDVYIFLLGCHKCNLYRDTVSIVLLYTQQGSCKNCSDTIVTIMMHHVSFEPTDPAPPSIQGGEYSSNISNSQDVRPSTPDHKLDCPQLVHDSRRTNLLACLLHYMVDSCHLPVLLAFPPNFV